MLLIHPSPDAAKCWEARPNMINGIEKIDIRLLAFWNVSGNAENIRHPIIKTAVVIVQRRNMMPTSAAFRFA